MRLRYFAKHQCLDEVAVRRNKNGALERGCVVEISVLEVRAARESRRSERSSEAQASTPHPNTITLAYRFRNTCSPVVWLLSTIAIY